MPSSPKSPSMEASESESRYAFLVHSQNTLTRNLPPRVDNKILARQKRRRTSPEDHAVLEAEYKKNSKPDKAARASIVSRVALGEKEVQIWFQNRRQNDRRRSRPLMPHEMIPHLKNSQYIPPLVERPHCLETTSPPSIDNTTPPSSCAPVSTDVRSSSRSPSIHDLLNPDPSPDIEATQTPAMPQVQQRTSSSTAGISPNAEDKETEQASDGQISKPATHLPKKRTYEETGPAKLIQGGQMEDSSGSLSDRHYRVRLSRSLDGSVKVKTTDDDTPSPPKERFHTVEGSAPTPSNLQRSKSVSSLKPSTIDSSHTRSRPGSGNFGRSRDSRTWEFYCDSDARESLSVHAELERTGSAAGAIGLIRSSSKRGSDGPRQALTPKLGGSNSKIHGSERMGKPKIARTMSSMARIQGNKANSQPPKSQVGQTEKAQKTGRPGHGRSPSTDSDKENWAPGTRDSIHPMRRQYSAFPAGSRPVLRETMHGPSHAGGLGISGAQRSRFTGRGTRKEVALDVEEVDDEVAAFMGSNAGGEEEDLDCVQGLLSLSQGAWK